MYKSGNGQTTVAQNGSSRHRISIGFDRGEMFLSSLEPNLRNRINALNPRSISLSVFP